MRVLPVPLGPTSNIVFVGGTEGTLNCMSLTYCSPRGRIPWTVTQARSCAIDGSLKVSSFCCWWLPSTFISPTSSDKGFGSTSFFIIPILTRRCTMAMSFSSSGVSPRSSFTAFSPADGFFAFDVLPFFPFLAFGFFFFFASFASPPSLASSFLPSSPPAFFSFFFFAFFPFFLPFFSFFPFDPTMLLRYASSCTSTLGQISSRTRPLTVFRAIPSSKVCSKLLVSSRVAQTCLYFCTLSCIWSTSSGTGAPRVTSAFSDGAAFSFFFLPFFFSFFPFFPFFFFFPFSSSFLSSRARNAACCSGVRLSRCFLR
mmetsp:Transcript_1143/g.2137  ORF Transcript_1143/g.2137 Transcript_1143/m.2137 type:complete len:313 (+) Transcript_1143:946-1884(+)